MSTNYPGALDTTTNLINNATDATVTATTHAQAHNNVADSLIAIETALGVNPKGTYASVAAWLADALVKTPGSAQTITPSGDTVPLILKSGNTLNVSNMQEWRDASSVIQAFMDKSFILSTQGLKIAGTALASTHLSDGATLAHLNSPAFTGTPTAPTAAVDTNTTQVATTAYVVGQGYLKSALAASTYAPLNSPALTGTPTAPTPTATDNSTRIATTAFVKAQTVGYGTAFPGSPTDGQEFVLVDSVTAPTYAWRCRYNASNTGSYKWEFVGGSPVHIDGTNTTSSNGGSVDATGATFTVPHAGVYEVEFGYQAGGGTGRTGGAGSNIELFGQLVVNGVGVGQQLDNSVQLYNGTSTMTLSSVAHAVREVTATAVAQIIKITLSTAAYAGSGGYSATAYGIYLTVIPKFLA